MHDASRSVNEPCWNVKWCWGLASTGCGRSDVTITYLTQTLSDHWTLCSSLWISVEASLAVSISRAVQLGGRCRWKVDSAWRTSLQTARRCPQYVAPFRFQRYELRLQSGPSSSLSMYFETSVSITFAKELCSSQSLIRTWLASIRSVVYAIRDPACVARTKTPVQDCTAQI